MNKKVNDIISVLEKYIKSDFSAVKNDFSSIQEIRLTVNKPVLITKENRIYSIGSSLLSFENIRNIFSAFCEYSVHTYQKEICEGFITSEGGIRIGICGTAVYENQKISNIKDISSLNIRIPHEINGCAERLEKFDRGILIIGPPCSGKTTLLRDYARIKSKNSRLVIVDERMEIAGIYRGIPCFDIGFSSVMNGFNKCDGIKMAVRSMSPDYIICDEFGDEDDINSAVYAMKSGAKIVATIHSSDKEDLMSKPLFSKILSLKIFDCFVFLDRSCKIKEIYSETEMLT